eukprot:jgi/Botrbrau1/15713/Bobra.4_1s0084.1
MAEVGPGVVSQAEFVDTDTQNGQINSIFVTAMESATDDRIGNATAVMEFPGSTGVTSATQHLVPNDLQNINGSDSLNHAEHENFGSKMGSGDSRDIRTDECLRSTRRSISRESMSVSEDHSGSISERLSTPLRQHALYASGYRPTTSEIEAQIDGFNDDFEPLQPVESALRLVEASQGLEHRTPAEHNEHVEPQSSAVANKDDASLASQSGGSEGPHERDPYRLNLSLQRGIREVLDQRGAAVARGVGEARKAQPSEARYQASLMSWKQTQLEHSALSQRFAAQLAALQEEQLARSAQADRLEKAFRQLVVKAAEAASSDSHARSTVMKAVNRWLASEEDREEELKLLRYKSIRLQQALTRVEHHIIKQEKLGSGLHLIDVEQLKSENQSLNEKIEERNLELSGLRKKLRLTVAELAHVKEKFFFEEKVVQELQNRKDEAEAALACTRDEVVALKRRRDKRRTAVQLARQTASTITDPLLLDKLKALMSKRELRDEIRQLEARHANLVEATAQMKAKTAALQNGQKARVRVALRDAVPKATQSTPAGAAAAC